MKHSGITLIEILIVVGILAIILGIAVPPLLRTSRQVNLDDAAQAMSQAIQEARTKSLANGNNWRVRILDTRNYVLEENVSGSWTTRKTTQLPNSLVMTNTAVGDTIEFESRGFATFSIAATAKEWRVQGTGRTVRVIPSMVGAVRILKL